MNINSISHLNKRTQKRITEYINGVRDIAGDGLVSVILYGNAAMENFDIRGAQLNFLLVLKDITVGFLTSYSRLRKRFRNIAAPLLFTPELMRTSFDIFPMEFLSLKESYIPLYGDDLLRNIDVRAEDLRYEIEQQVKRRLIKTREEFLYSVENREDLEQLLTTSLIAFTPLFKNILRLVNRECPVEGALFKEFCAEMGLDEGPFFKIWAIKTGERRLRKKELVGLFGDFIREIEALAARLDSIKPADEVCSV